MKTRPMHAPRPPLQRLWRGFVLLVLMLAACTRDDTPESIPAAARKSMASPVAQPSARVVKGWDVRAAPTVATRVADAGAGPSNQAQSTPANEGLDFEIDADPDIGTAPLTVRFAAVANEGLPAPLSYRWDFGDGSTGESSAAIHTYTTAGEYTATLTMTDGSGRSATRDVQIQVDPREPGGDGADQ